MAKHMTAADPDWSLTPVTQSPNRFKIKIILALKIVF